MKPDPGSVKQNPKLTPKAKMMAAAAEYQTVKAYLSMADGTQLEVDATLHPLGVIDEVWSHVAEIDLFDRLTAKGLRLNLITGNYETPLGTLHRENP